MKKIYKFLNTAWGSFTKYVSLELGLVWATSGNKIFTWDKAMLILFANMLAGAVILVIINAKNPEDTRYSLKFRKVKPLANLPVEEKPLEKPE